MEKTSPVEAAATAGQVDVRPSARITPAGKASTSPASASSSVSTTPPSGPFGEWPIRICNQYPCTISSNCASFGPALVAQGQQSQERADDKIGQGGERIRLDDSESGVLDPPRGVD